MKILIILCGGRGKRLGAITKFVPKPLIKINKKEFIYHLLKFYSKYFDIIELYAGYKGKKFLSYGNSKIRVKIEKKKLGTGGAIISNLDNLPNYFYVTNGDTYLYNFNIKKFIKKCEKTKKSTILITRDEQKQKGAVEINKKNEIVGFYEKKSKKNGFIYAGLVFFKKQDLKKIDKKNRINLSLEKDIFPQLIKDKKLEVFISKKVKVFDIGTPKGISKFRRIINKIK
ncbi:MAG: sugar phosphate nucleotidyltransferase [Candidatus Anstonellaceae archaeon]